VSGLSVAPGVPLLVLGFLLGMKHALDADHVVAISTMATGQRSLKQSCVVGVWWGVGHTVVLLVAGLAVLGWHRAMPSDLARLFEAGVGVMLIGLGLSVGWTLCRERLHLHVHTHEDGVGHVHAHTHREGQGPTHVHRYRLAYKSLVVGMMHGLAGSAALLLLVLSTAPSFTEGMLSILVFGMGSILGMALLSAVVNLPFVMAPERLVRTRLALQALAGLASVSLGGRMVYEFWVM